MLPRDSRQRFPRHPHRRRPHTHRRNAVLMMRSATHFLLFFSLCATIMRSLSLRPPKCFLSPIYVYISLLFALFRSRAFFFSAARAQYLSLSLSHVRSFVSDGQKRIDGKRERKRERERESYKREFEMTNTSCFSREREREKKKKKVKTFFSIEKGQKNVKKILFLDARALRMSHLHTK